METRQRGQIFFACRTSQAQGLRGNSPQADDNRIYFILFMMAAKGGGGMKKKVNGHLPLKKIKIDSRRPLIVIGDLHVRNIKTFNG